jgi:hypothetical protein
MFSFVLFILLKPFDGSHFQPLPKRLLGVGYFVNQNYAARLENGSSWWECLCDVCFASKTSSRGEFLFPPECT